MIRPPAGRGASTAYVYLLRSQVDGSLYLGWTTDVMRRVVEHNDAHVPFTSRKTPWDLIGFEVFVSSAAAMRRERELKRNRRMRTLFQKRMLNRAAVGSPRQVVG